MKIEIFKDETGPYPNKLHEYSSYMQRIINEIEKIGIENIFELNIFYDREMLNIDDDDNIEIRPNSITIRNTQQYSTITKIIDITKVFKIQISSD